MSESELPATQRRLDKARAEGDVPLSRELGLLASLAAGIGVIALGLPEAAGGFARRLAAILADPARAGPQIDALMQGAAIAVLAVAGGAMAASVFAGLAQTGFLFRPEALGADLTRVSPIGGLRRLFGTDGLIAAGKSSAKLAVLIACTAAPLTQIVRTTEGAASLPAGKLMAAVCHAGWRLCLALLGVQAAAALADLALVRWRHAVRLRMTRQEQRDEHRESEGNPEIKQKQRAIARMRARRRMMAAVPKASVIITNPTHYAVALAYQRGAATAPKVVAKGADEIAAKIREIGREHSIPMVANPPLARALYRVELESEIPAEHFRAVAEIIAYVWRLRAPPRRMGA